MLICGILRLELRDRESDSWGVRGGAGFGDVSLAAFSRKDHYGGFLWGSYAYRQCKLSLLSSG